MTGVIKTLNYERGYFFVTGEDEREYFAHRTSLSDPQLFDELQKGDAVVLTVEDSPKGPRATSVIPVASPTTAA